ncbi:DUF1080 domain-containing protein [Lentisphaera marina]|uniref:3-keto-disaccharide hydrolase n=1 Tax=Lentisphaera marina TaxID=1111041 RepID=UPI002366F101|nr:DUF1080 domain-containing protein [Lentisphaera marina]MDD7985257.1 DUF1080 domain-containing protein [Lentisphaera marina]
MKRKTQTTRRSHFLLTGCILIVCFAKATFAEEGFSPLFDGTSLEGWTAAKSKGDKDWGAFSINKEEKAIHVYAGKKQGSEQEHDCLVSKKQFSHFILRMEYKWLDKRFEPRLNWDRDGGLLFHVHGDLKKVWPNCFEMQIGETPAHVRGNTKDYWKGRKPTHRFHSGDYFIVPPRAHLRSQIKRKGPFWDPNGELISTNGAVITPFGKEKPKGEWNEIEIRVLGHKKATFILNGEVVFETVNMEQKKDGKFVPIEKGHIGLQAESAELLYRNIRIKELDGNK